MLKNLSRPLAALMVVSMVLSVIPFNVIIAFAEEIETPQQPATEVIVESQPVADVPAEISSDSSVTTTETVVESTESVSEPEPVKVDESSSADTTENVSVDTESIDSASSANFSGEAAVEEEVTDTTSSNEVISENNENESIGSGDVVEAVSNIVNVLDNAFNAVTFESITTDTKYSSVDGDFGITFNSLPEGTHSIQIKKITLTPEEMEDTGAVSSVAYDVTSPDMADGTFTFDLSMPLPENADPADLEVKFAETRSELSQAESVPIEDVKTENGKIVAEDVNHFTIFLVTSGTNTNNSGVGTPLDVSQIAALQSSDNNRLNKNWGNNFGLRSQEFSFGAAYPVNSSILSATVRIELQRDTNIDTAQLEYWNGSAYDTVNPENILPASAGVDQTFTFNVPTNYINTPAKVNAFTVRVRASGFSCAGPACYTDIDFLRLQVVTGDRATNTFPADQANVSTATAGFTYTWTAVPYATTYEFERCTINPGTSDCAVAGGTVIDSATGLGTPDLTVGTGYAEALNSYWHVRTIFNDGEVSPWSDAFRLTIDNTAPLITYTPDPQAPDGANGWYITAVPIDFICADTGAVQSGIATDVTGDTTFNEGAGQTATSGAGTCVDNAGNVATPVTTSAFNVDLTDPTITAARDVSPNANGWNNTAVTVTFTCTDATSGIDTCSAPETFSSEGTGMSSTGTAVDFSGRTSSVTETPINIDLSAPVIALDARTPAANGNGWNNTSVTVTWTCDASIAGLDAGASTLTQTLSTEGAGQSTTGTCTDLAGNVSTDTQTGINIDLTNPIITFTGRTTPNAFNWNNTNVDVNWSCSDALSGVVTGTLLNTLTTNAADQTSTGTCEDLAGNTSSDTQVNIDIDKIRPDHSIIAPANDAHVSPTFIVNGTASDQSGLSGVRDIRVQFRDEVTNALVSTFFATYDSGTDTWTRSITAGELVDGYYRVNVRSRDYAGNTRTRINRRVYVDRVAPVITILGSNPATHEALSVYADAGATSLDNIDGDLTAGIVTTNNVNANVLGTYTVDYSSTDLAGNTGTASRTVNVVDTTIPVITLNGGAVEFTAPGNYTEPGYTATDNYDGDITPRVVVSGTINSNVAGTYTLTYNVTDLSGNAAVAVTRSVTVRPSNNGPIDGTAPSTGFVPGAQGGPSSGGGGGGGSVLGAFFGPNGSFFGGGTQPFQRLTGALEAPKLNNQTQTSGGTVLGDSKFMFTKNLRQGMRNQDVTELQKRLIAEGLLSADSTTGYFGRLTLAAVKAYQKKYAIPETGFVGPLTRASLNK